MQKFMQMGTGLFQLQSQYPNLSVSELISALHKAKGDPTKAGEIIKQKMDSGKARPAGSQPDIRAQPEAWFQYYDRDNDGLEKHEVEAAVGETFKGPQVNQMRKVVTDNWHRFDPDGSGTISVREFLQPGGLRDTLVAALSGGAAANPGHTSFPAAGYAPSAGYAPAPAAPAGPTCRNGCGRKPFGKFPTCCTWCKGASGPHHKDCENTHRASVAAPRPSQPAASSPGMMCPKGHILGPYSVPDAGGCDGCGTRVERGEHVMDCRSCNWYLCDNCSRRAKPAAASSQPSVRCPKGHPLAMYRTPETGGCDGCGQRVEQGTQVMDCRACNFYLCDRCVRQASTPGAAVSRPSGFAPSAGGGRRKALLIGINYTGTKAALKGCVNDVTNMTKLLTETYRWDRNSITTLTDAQATKKNMMSAMSALVAGARPGDAFIFHFSGHGSQSEDPHGIEEDGMNETIVPIDFQKAGMITDDVLDEILIRPLPEGCRITGVMDCCHSGSGLDLPFSKDAGKAGREWKLEVNPFYCACDAQLFAGCDDDQTSADVQGKYAAPGGAMTSAFCEELRKKSNPGYTELITEMNRIMKQKGFKQCPQLTSSQAFQFPRQFTLTDAIPNSNRQLGRVMTHGKFKPNPRPMAEGDPLAEMLGDYAPLVAIAQQLGGKKAEQGIALLRMALSGGIK